MQNQLRKILAEDVSDHKILITRSLLAIFPTIETHIKTDSIIRNQNIILTTSLDKIFCAIDFSDFEKHEASVEFSFNDLLKSKDLLESPLSILGYAYSALNEDGCISIFPLNSNSNRNVVSKFLKCAKFTDVEFKGDLITAKKRRLRKYIFDHGRLTFEETNSKDAIKYIQYFAKGLFKNYNFDIRIDDLFSPHSDFFVCYRTESKEIVAFLRYTWHLPKHPLPCMLATNIEDGSHIQLDNPDKEIYGEIFAPYINTFSAVKSYKELIKNILDHCLTIGATKVFTTYDKLDPISGEFFKKVFGFKDSGIVLRYGDFGGEWGLLQGGETDIIPVVKQFLKKRAE